MDSVRKVMMEKILQQAHHYRMPLDGKYAFFLPKSLTVVDGDRDTAYILDSCSIPVCYSTLVLRVSKVFPKHSESEIQTQIDRMISIGLLDEISKTNFVNGKVLPQIPHSDILHFNRITVHVTDRCNLECKYCYNKTERIRHQREELNHNEWGNIFDDIFRYRKPRKVTISGGEPLLYNDLEKVIHTVINHNVPIEMITNGTVLSDTAERVYGLLDNVVISIDSHIDTINDITRGNGTFSKAIATMDLLEKLGRQFSINTVITKYNIDTISETVKYFMNKYNHLTNVLPLFQESTHLAPDILPTLFQMDKHTECNLLATISDDLLASRLALAWSDSLSYREACTVASKEFALAADGQVLPCRALYFESMNAGKLNGSNFAEVWENSPVLQEVRDANNKRSDICRETSCDFSSICLGGCLAHSYSATGKLAPYADENDCYRYKQECMQKMHIKIKAKHHEL
jgi:radical SAM protein with 4Fe4S-binding SPASM domain